MRSTGESGPRGGAGRPEPDKKKKGQIDIRPFDFLAEVRLVPALLRAVPATAAIVLAARGLGGGPTLVVSGVFVRSCLVSAAGLGVARLLSLRSRGWRCGVRGCV